ncbi:hypothetical protein OROGR_001947 [Orobanche gracilis]
MERDFMGLNSNNPIVIKEEFVEGGCEDFGFTRSSGVPWQLSNEPSALPHFMYFNCDQEEKSSKVKKSDILASHACVANSGLDTFEAMDERRSADIQNFGGANIKQQFLGGLSMAGTAEQWNNSKASNASNQLTIFYGGTVNVFDDITPEKAQAIIFLAGNGCAPSNVAQTKHHMQALDRALVNQSMNIPPPSNLRNRMCDDPSEIPRANSDEVVVSKTGCMSASVFEKAKPPRAVLPIRSVAPSSLISSAVPQARKASLARFLKKRKERAMNAAADKLSKNITDDCATRESTDFGLSATSGVCSSPVSMSKRD